MIGISYNKIYYTSDFQLYIQSMKLKGGDSDTSPLNNKNIRILFCVKDYLINDNYCNRERERERERVICETQKLKNKTKKKSVRLRTIIYHQYSTIPLSILKPTQKPQNLAFSTKLHT